ncbi:MAG TPA: hypothetical protein VFX28_09370 [Methylomirabilota bacterium]|nr:hypothetical protein [Methylomirabilota bacterium]
MGGLAAALKSLFAGSAGVKVAALTVAAATTATVVATDPVGVWQDRPVPGLAAVVEQKAPPAAFTSPPSTVPAKAIVAPAEAVPRPAPAAGDQAKPRSERGRASGQATAAAAKAKKDEKDNAGGNGKGKALGHAKEPNAPASSSGHTPPARGKAAPPGLSQDGPPVHAPAKGQAKRNS